MHRCAVINPSSPSQLLARLNLLRMCSVSIVLLWKNTLPILVSQTRPSIQMVCGPCYTFPSRDSYGLQGLLKDPATAGGPRVVRVFTLLEGAHRAILIVGLQGAICFQEARPCCITVTLENTRQPTTIPYRLRRLSAILRIELGVPPLLHVMQVHPDEREPFAAPLFRRLHTRQGGDLLGQASQLARLGKKGAKARTGHRFPVGGAVSSLLISCPPRQYF